MSRVAFLLVSCRVWSVGATVAATSITAFDTTTLETPGTITFSQSHASTLEASASDQIVVTLTADAAVFTPSSTPSCNLTADTGAPAATASVDSSGKIITLTVTSDVVGGAVTITCTDNLEPNGANTNTVTGTVYTTQETYPSPYASGYTFTDVVTSCACSKGGALPCCGQAVEHGGGDSTGSCNPLYTCGSVNYQCTGYVYMSSYGTCTTTEAPTGAPTRSPTHAPTNTPTSPTHAPTISPTHAPTAAPTDESSFWSVPVIIGFAAGGTAVLGIFVVAVALIVIILCCCCACKKKKSKGDGAKVQPADTRSE